MKTAIEWLELEFEKYTRGGVQVPNEKIFKLTEKAKQKEKEQIIEAGNFCQLYNDGFVFKNGEDYYDITYNQNK